LSVPIKQMTRNERILLAADRWAVEYEEMEVVEAI